MNTYDITIVSSLYRTDKYIKNWSKALDSFVDEAALVGIRVQSVIIANEPTKIEHSELIKIKEKPYVKIIEVGRESLYASWNRGVREADAEVVSFWNVDDFRFFDAVSDGLKSITAGAELVYFPIIYKRYLTFFGIDFLVKKTIFRPAEFDRNRFINEMHCGPFFIFTKKLYEKVGPFDETFKIAGDFDWCSRAAKETEFVRSSKIGGIFEKRDGTLSGGKNTLQEEENGRVYSKNI